MTVFRKSVLRLLVCVVSCAGPGIHPAQGQSSPDRDSLKFWISFVDKDNGPGNGPVAVEPGRVSSRALARRMKRGRVPAGGLDAPVSPYYLARLRALGVEPIVQSRWLNAVSAYLSPEKSESVSRLEFVRSITPVAQSVELAESTQPEPLPSEAPAVYNLDYGASLAQLQAINAVQPIEDGFIGTGVRLGFLDTTTDTLHPALQHLADSGRVVATRDFTVEAGLTVQSNKHGLSTSSTAMGFDEGDLIGPCYGGEYIFATTEYVPFEQNQEEDFFVAGMEWLELMGADIVNVSLGYSEFDFGEDSYTYEDMDGATAKTTVVSDLAVGLGVVVVASAGNSGCSNPDACWYYITSPADGDSVITAGAVDASDNRLTFSSRGPTFDGRIKPDVAALGTGVRNATGASGYSSSSGTSFSSPLVAGVACQILQADPTLDPIEVRTLLRSTAGQSDNPDNDKGWGVVNAAEAVRLASLLDHTAPVLAGLTLIPDTVDVTTGSAQVAIQVRASDNLSGVKMVEVCLADPSGGELCGSSANPDSGGTLSGRWDVAITIPQASETGTWRVSEIALQDSVVSAVAYDSTALSGSGFPTEVEVVVRFDVAVHVLMEGPYTADGMMATGPIYEAAISLQHPFDSSAFTGTPLFFNGPGSVVSLPPGTIDWLLISLRSDPSPDSSLESSTQAVLLLDDGSVVDTFGADPTFYSPGGLSWHVVIRARNHGAIMSPTPIDFSTGHGVWDFRDSLGAAHSSGGDPLIMLEVDQYGMFACDISIDGQVTATDFNLWLTSTKAASTGYLQEDCDLDGQVTASDFNLWLANTKAAYSSQVP